MLYGHTAAVAEKMPVDRGAVLRLQ